MNYYNLFDNILNNLAKNEYKLFFLIDYEYNILNDFSHIIKKKNLDIHILIDNILIYNKMLKNIKGEDCENNIKLYKNIEDIFNINFNLINLYNIKSLIFFESILNYIPNILDKDTVIYLYCALSNENERKIIYKNYIRTKIINLLNKNIGYILPLSGVLKIIENNNYSIKKVKIYQKNNYIIYGDNTLYEIIFRKEFSE